MLNCESSIDNWLLILTGSPHERRSEVLKRPIFAVTRQSCPVHRSGLICCMISKVPFLDTKLWEPYGLIDRRLRTVQTCLWKSHEPHVKHQTKTYPQARTSANRTYQPCDSSFCPTAFQFILGVIDAKNFQISRPYPRGPDQICNCRGERLI